MEYRIERLSASNIGLLKPLFRDVFKQTVSIDFLRRKYDTKAYGAQYIGYFAFDPQEKVAAYYGVIPCHLQINGAAFLAAQSADTMTHPDHRNKGLFIMLAEKTYALAREQQIRLVFGFPNQNSTPGFQKLGWRFMEEGLQVFSLKVPTIPYARFIGRSAITRSLYSRVMHSKFQAALGNWKFTEENVNGLERDSRFLAYKTYYKNFIAEIADVKIWFRADGRLKIGAVNGLTESNALSFLELVKSLAGRLGCNEVIFMTSKNSHVYKSLVAHIAALNAFPIGYFKLSNEAPSFDNVSFEYCDIDIF